MLEGWQQMWLRCGGVSIRKEISVALHDCTRLLCIQLRRIVLQGKSTIMIYSLSDDNRCYRPVFHLAAKSPSRFRRFLDRVLLFHASTSSAMLIGSENQENAFAVMVSPIR